MPGSAIIHDEAIPCSVDACVFRKTCRLVRTGAHTHTPKIEAYVNLQDHVVIVCNSASNEADADPPG